MNWNTATLSQLQEALRDGKTTASALLEAHISTIEKVNPTVNGLVADRYTQARSEAQAADARFKSSDGNLPPLLGIPCTIKEFIGVKGQPQTGGVLWRKEVVAEKDATVVQRLKAAGAIIMGTTNIPEGGLWLETYNAIYGRTNNPWDPRKTSGGSSGGEGVLVATGASPFGIGSDVGGSIRIPAAFCGTVGHKPTGGLVPNTGHYPEGMLTEAGGRYLTVGPLTRTVDDAWMVLKIIAGEDGIDKSMGQSALGNPDEVDLAGIRVFPLTWNLRSRVRGDVRLAITQASEALKAQGATVDTREFPAMKRAFEIWSAMLSEGTIVSYPHALGESGPLNPLVELPRLWSGYGRHTFAAIFMCAADRIAAALPSLAKKYAAMGRALQEELEDALGENGVILHPPYNRPAPRHWDAFRTPFVPAYTALFNVMEFPVTQVPAGFSQEGLPLGVQVAAARGNDHLTIAAGRCIEQALGGWKQAFID
jgi:fatty acid amide hydrolase 2